MQIIHIGLRRIWKELVYIYGTHCRNHEIELVNNKVRTCLQFAALMLIPISKWTIGSEKYGKFRDGRLIKKKNLIVIATTWGFQHLRSRYDVISFSTLRN